MKINEELADLYRQQICLKKELSQIDSKIGQIQKNVSEEIIIITMSNVLENDEDFITWFKQRKKKIEKREKKDLIKSKVEILDNDYTYLYSLICKKEVVYIGITKNLKNRIKEHKKTKTFDDYKILSLYEDRFYALREENNLIKKYNPKYNKQFF